MIGSEGCQGSRGRRVAESMEDVMDAAEDQVVAGMGSLVGNHVRVSHATPTSKRCNIERIGGLAPCTSHLCHVATR